MLFFKRCLLITASLCLAIAISLSARLVELNKIIPGICLDIRYATANNFVGVPVYASARCFLEEDAARALARVQESLKKQGLALKVYDGYRPFPVQQHFWKVWFPIAQKLGIKDPSDYVAEPKTDAKGTPIKGSKHNRGNAVDLTLIDLKTGKELVMPSAFDDFTEKAHRNYTAMVPAAATNCRLLEKLMVKEGFSPLPTEWWHFNWGDWEKYPLRTETFEELDKIEACA